MFLVGYPQTLEPVIPLVDWHKLTYLVLTCRKTPINQSINQFDMLLSVVFQFDMLLGVLQTDGSRRFGAIDKFHLDTQKIIELVARDTESKGQFEDSVRLYDLAMVWCCHICICNLT